MTDERRPPSDYRWARQVAALLLIGVVVVILLLDAASIAGDLHSAVRALPATAWRSQLTFISGPSKTADIEQTLVHGAHGPRALAVFLHHI